MDLLLLLKAFVLGAIEGLTEFLPVSSTGHLIIAGDLLNFNDERGKVFTIAIQLGAILAICWEYRARLAEVAVGLGGDTPQRRFAINVLIAFFPAVVLGLVFHKIIKTYLFNPYTVAGALIIGGFIILYVERRQARQGARINDLDAIGWKDALKVGLAQSVAMFPGVSRSGATIMGGMIFGLSRPVATQFSFFLAIPTMFAATTYDVYKSRDLLNLSDLPVFAVGFVTAFFVALVVVRGLLRYVSNHSFAPFAWYRIVFGVVVLFYFNIYGAAWAPEA